MSSRLGAVQIHADSGELCFELCKQYGHLFDTPYPMILTRVEDQTFYRLLIYFQDGGVDFVDHASHYELARGILLNKNKPELVKYVEIQGPLNSKDLELVMAFPSIRDSSDYPWRSVLIEMCPRFVVGVNNKEDLASIPAWMLEQEGITLYVREKPPPFMDFSFEEEGDHWLGRRTFSQ